MALRTTTPVDGVVVFCGIARPHGSSSPPNPSIFQFGTIDAHPTSVPRSTTARVRSRLAAPRRLALTLGMMLALPSLTGSAAAATPPVDAAGTSDPVEPDEPALERARELYELGHARFETFDYEGAVQMWTEAYAEVPANADWIRNRMVYNIATAQQRAYDVDRDIGHLRQAVLLLEHYVTDYERLHDDAPEAQAELDKAHARIDALSERIERDSRDDEAAAIESSPERLDGIVWRPSAQPLDPAQLERNQRLSSADRKTDRMLVASTVTLSLGGVLTLVGAGTVAGTQNGDAGAQGAGYGTLGLGLAGLTTGVTLLAVGLKRRRRARRGTLVGAAPALGPGFTGASVSMRF